MILRKMPKPHQLIHTVYSIWDLVVSFALQCAILCWYARYSHHCEPCPHEIYFREAYKTNHHQDGPASANYDEDLGTLPLTDWYYTPGFMINDIAMHSRRGPPPVPDNILVNGTHVNANGGGQYFKMSIKQVFSLETIYSRCT